MNDTEKFLFDLQGFLKVPDFLTPDEVDALNAAFDANEDKRGEANFPLSQKICHWQEHRD